jgi:hypothetical protein
VALSCTSGPC